MVELQFEASSLKYNTNTLLTAPHCQNSITMFSVLQQVSQSGSKGTRFDACLSVHLQVQAKESEWLAKVARQYYRIQLHINRP